MFVLFIICTALLMFGAGIGGWYLFNRVDRDLLAVIGGLFGALIAVVSFCLLCGALFTGGDVYQRDIVVTSVINIVNDGHQAVTVEGVTLSGRDKDQVTCTEADIVKWCADLKVGDTITLVTQNNEYGFGTTRPAVTR